MLKQLHFSPEKPMCKNVNPSFAFECMGCNPQKHEEICLVRILFV